MRVDGHRVRSQAVDDRVVCGACQRRMVPRVITYRGNVERTVCPFCGETYLDFVPDMSISWRAVGWTVLAAVGIVTLMTFVA